MYKEIRLLSDTIYKVYYVESNKTVYILPPVKVGHIEEIRKMLKYYKLDIKNIVVGRVYESYL